VMFKSRNWLKLKRPRFTPKSTNRYPNSSELGRSAKPGPCLKI